MAVDACFSGGLQTKSEAIAGYPLAAQTAVGEFLQVICIGTSASLALVH